MEPFYVLVRDDNTKHVYLDKHGTHYTNKVEEAKQFPTQDALLLFLSNCAIRATKYLGYLHGETFSIAKVTPKVPTTVEYEINTL